jgi:hypothetical protein
MKVTCGVAAAAACGNNVVLHIAVRWQMAGSRQIKRRLEPGFSPFLAPAQEGCDGF